MDIILKNMVYEIVNEIGYGYSENVYQNAFKVLLKNNGYTYQEEFIQPIIFKNVQIGIVRLDLIINNTDQRSEDFVNNIIIELKVLSKISDKEINQVQRYMKLTKINEAYIINFGLKE